MFVRSCHVDQLDAIALSQGELKVLVVPELGGKICSIQWQGREVLTRNMLRPAQYGAPFAEFDASGFDECVPSIGPCDYPVAPWNGTDVPDHGEVWSIPWSFEVESGQLRLRTDGIRFPYTFEKVITFIDESRVSLQYRLLNHAPFPFPFLWSAHPLLAIQPGWRIHLPNGTRVVVDWSRDQRLGQQFSEHDWPETRDRDGRLVDLSFIRDRDVATVEKLYTNRLDEGWCALHDPEDRFYVAMLFDPEEIPYVGLSINFGGWPEDGPGYYNLGLEPCNGFPDRLDLALERGSCPVVPPLGQLTWHLYLHLGRCTSVPAEIERLRAWSLAA
jgi:galactose mutarotase-like enzyme